MTAAGFTIDRTVVNSIDGGFIAFGPGRDIDEAFDGAVTTDRFELGSSGLVPSIVDIDPAKERRVVGETMHPWEAISLLVAQAAACEKGEIVACSVTSVSAWKHTKSRIVLEDPTLEIADRTGLIFPLGGRLEEAIATGLPEGAKLVAAELVREPRRRYKVVATSIKGPRKPGYAVIENGRVISVHPNSSEARRAAVTEAKASVGARRLEVRPWISRNEKDPYLNVERKIVAQKAAIKVVTAELKNPDKTKVVGWLFAGRV